jgi:adenylate cyclase
VVSGNIGSAVKMEYTVVGDSVNVASHISNLAGPGEVFISQGIYDSIQDLIEVERLPARQLKGKSTPVPIFKVLSIKESSPL